MSPKPQPVIIENRPDAANALNIATMARKQALIARSGLRLVKEGWGTLSALDPLSDYPH